MKKFLLVTIIIAGVNQARAQALITRPNDSIASGFFNRFGGIKQNDTANYGKFFRMPDINSPLKQIKLNRTIVADPLVSTMPVVKLKSSDRMPIAKLTEGNTRYTMLVKKIEVVDPAVKVVLVTP